MFHTILLCFAKYFPLPLTNIYLLLSINIFFPRIFRTSTSSFFILIYFLSYFVFALHWRDSGFNMTLHDAVWFKFVYHFFVRKPGFLLTYLCMYIRSSAAFSPLQNEIRESFSRGHCWNVSLHVIKRTRFVDSSQARVFPRAIYFLLEEREAWLTAAVAGISVRIILNHGMIIMSERVITHPPLQYFCGHGESSFHVLSYFESKLILTWHTEVIVDLTSFSLFLSIYIVCHFSFWYKDKMRNAIFSTFN